MNDSSTSTSTSTLSVLMPLPDVGFDVTESAVPWKLLCDAGIDVVFCTESGAVASADPTLLNGVLWKNDGLSAHAEPKQFYSEMIQSANFLQPLAWKDGLFLVGGHAKGINKPI
jgi:protease I